MVWRVRLGREAAAGVQYNTTRWREAFHISCLVILEGVEAASSVLSLSRETVSARIRCRISSLQSCFLATFTSNPFLFSFHFHDLHYIL